MYAPTSQDMSMSASPLDIDAVLYEIALARNSAVWAATGGSSRRPRTSSSRITKPGSAGNSPTRIQRRRTSASHKVAKYRSELYPHQPPTAFPAPDGYARRPAGVMPARPLSWHPSTMMSTMTPSSDYYSPPHRYSVDYQTVDINGMPTPMSQAQLPSDVPADWCLNFDAPSIYPDGYGYSSFSSQRPFDTYPPTLMYGPMSHFFQSSEAAATFSPSAGSMQNWPTAPTQAMAFTAPPTPDVLPIQRPADPMSNSADVSPMEPHPKHQPVDDVDDEPELVGMGLYDAPTEPSFLFDGAGAHGSATSSPTGKGLKLEETWEPPQEGDGAEGDDEHDADGEEDDGMETGFVSAESLPIEQPPNSGSISMPIERPESLSSPTTTLAMPIEPTDQLVSPSCMDIPIQQPESAKFSVTTQPLDTASIHMPIEHPDPLSPMNSGYPGRTFYLERDGGSMDEVNQLWLQAMLMHGMGSAMAD